VTNFRAILRCLLSCLVIFLWVNVFYGSLKALEGLTAAEKQVVIDTDLGVLIMEVYPQDAPNHVATFQQRIRDGFYIGTAFHMAIPWAIVQGGDPLTRDPTNRESYGMGGLGELDREANDIRHLAGTVSAVLVPGKPNSGGSQFFICVTDQLQLDGKYTPFGRVVEGLETLEKISHIPTDTQQSLVQRIEITRTYERDRPPPPQIPFFDTPVEELKKKSVTIATELGEIEIRFFPEEAPEHVRQFLRFSEIGLYKGTEIHRVVPEFVIQGGSIATRKPRPTRTDMVYVKPLKGEFSNRKHLRGIVSMARGDDPDSGLDSFFIVLAPSPGLDGNYSVFGEVIRGIETVDGISQVPTRGGEPISPVYIQDIRIHTSP
jgi:cyclophilin family peptidyl-prolyl cis-trans isomerase